MSGIGQRIKGGFIALSLGAWLCAFTGAAPITVAPNVSIAPAPDWVQSRDWVAPITKAEDADSEGTRDLLYEIQLNPRDQDEFVRLVISIENEAGVQDSGNLSFRFDPSYEQLILHSVIIHRDGRALDRLDASKVKVIQREPDLYGHMLTGQQTALVFVEDLRVGDVLEYSYTTRGANPVLQGHFARRLVVQSGTPTERQRVRVVWNDPRPLHRRQHLVEMEPRVTDTTNGAEYVWDFETLPSIPWEDYLPIGYEAYPYIEVSDFEEWSRVVDWALPLYALAETNLPPELAELIARWQREGETDEARARFALQFVQDELRYTGLELGPDSYRPTPPLETFQKRFGDCKGKVVLLCLMLRQMDIEVYPALVNTYARGALGRRLASPLAFNHVIARLTIDGRQVWVDPTRSHQGGRLWDRYLPPLGKALVIMPGSRALEDIQPPDRKLGWQRTTSTFWMKDYVSPTRFEVATLYRGYSADDMRETLARYDLKELGQNYLNYFDRFYPGITNPAPLRVQDDREKNELSIIEKYDIPELWKDDEDTHRSEASFYADALFNMLSDPDTRQRKMPLRIPYPQRREQELVVHLPDADWNISPQEQTIEDAAFRYTHRRKYSGSTVRFEYECETKSPELAPELVAAYLGNTDKMQTLLGDALFRPSTSNRNIFSRINWLMVVVALFAFCGSCVGAGWYWWRSVNSVVPVAETLPPVLGSASKLNGLGGWLILVGFNLCVSPLLRIGQIIRHWEGFFGLDTWQVVSMPGTEAYHPLYTPLLMMEVVGNVGFLVFNLLAVVLFFGKRSTFPRVFISLLLFNAVFLVVDGLVSNSIPYIAQSSTNSSSRDATRAVIYAIIWCSYTVTSKRVKATFIR